MRSGRGALIVAVAMTATACGVGAGTLRIADAEAEIVRIAEAIVETVGLEVTGPLAAAPLEQCTLRSGAPGLRTRLSVRAPVVDRTLSSAAVFDLAASAIIDQGLIIVESGVPGTLLGQRDGVTVTVGGDVRALELDAITGCRPR